MQIRLPLPGRCLEVMLDNMRHFANMAERAETALAELSADKIAEMPSDEQFKYLLAEVKKAAGLREMAQSCARDAASYVHPKLSATALKVEAVRLEVLAPRYSSCRVR